MADDKNTKPEEGELNDTQLDSVAGGGFFDDIKKGATNFGNQVVDTFSGGGKSNPVTTVANNVNNVTQEIGNTIKGNTPNPPDITPKGGVPNPLDLFPTKGPKPTDILPKGPVPVPNPLDFIPTKGPKPTDILPKGPVPVPNPLDFIPTKGPKPTDILPKGPVPVPNPLDFIPTKGPKPTDILPKSPGGFPNPLDFIPTKGPKPQEGTGPKVLENSEIPGKPKLNPNSTKEDALEEQKRKLEEAQQGNKPKPVDPLDRFAEILKSGNIPLPGFVPPKSKP